MSFALFISGGITSFVPRFVPEFGPEKEAVVSEIGGGCDGEETMFVLEMVSAGGKRNDLS